VTIPITNKGKVRGAEVVQAYVRQKGASVFRPDRELKGFAKVWLDPEETAEAIITLDQRAFSFWDNDAQCWRVEPSEFEILIGESSAVIHRRPMAIAAITPAKRSVESSRLS
jgi:beta-glucosidase